MNLYNHSWGSTKNAKKIPNGEFTNNVRADLFLLNGKSITEANLALLPCRQLRKLIIPKITHKINQVLMKAYIELLRLIMLLKSSKAERPITGTFTKVFCIN